MAGTLKISTTPPLPGLTLVNDVNAAFALLTTLNQSASAPTTTSTGLASLAGFVWHDTSANQLKIRDQADTAWIIVGYFDETGKTFTPHINVAALYAIDTGTANNYAVAPTPAWTAYTTGAFLFFQVVHANTAASVINVSGLGNKALVRPDGSAFIGGEMAAGTFQIGIYDGTSVRALTAIPLVTNAMFLGQQSSGTPSGETLTASAFTARVINTTGINNIPGCSLAPNQITLAAGTYKFMIVCACSGGAANQSKFSTRLRNVTDSTTALVSPVSGTPPSLTEAVVTITTGNVTISGTKVFEVDTYNNSAVNGTGGVPSGSGEPEVYVNVVIDKVG